MPVAAVPGPLTSFQPALGFAGSYMARYSVPFTGPGTEMFAPNDELNVTFADDCAVRYAIGVAVAPIAWTTRRSLWSAGAPARGPADSVSAIVAPPLAGVRMMLPDTPPAAGGKVTVVGPLGETIADAPDTAGGAAVGTGVGVAATPGTGPSAPTEPPPPPQAHNAKNAALASTVRT